MRIAFWSVFAAGFLACSTIGIGPVLAKMDGNWLSAPMLVGSVVGLALLVVGVLYGVGVRPGLLGNDAAVLVLLVALIGVKVLVAATASGAAH